MAEIYHFVTVERIPVGNLALKRRAGGRTALEILERAESAHLLTDILGLLDALDYESDNDSEEDDDSDDDEAEEKIELLELMAIFHARRIINLDCPKVMSVRSIAIQEVSVNKYSDDECWRLLRFRKDDIIKLIGLLNMPLFLISPDRHSFSSEFAFILLLRRMAYPVCICLNHTQAVKPNDLLICE